MPTYIGVDNTQKGCLIMVCQLCEYSGAITTLWRRKLRGEAAIRRFFRHSIGTGFPDYFATTWVKLDPGGILAEHKANGAQLLRYRPLELKTVQHSALPARYSRAEQLATQAIQDTQFSTTIRDLRNDVKFLDSKIVSLLVLAGGMRRQIYALECQYPDPDLLEIPF